MANLGTEITRIFNFKEMGKIERARESARRASKIIESLVVHPNINGGKKEIEMIKEVMIDDVLSSTPQYRISKKNVADYFMPFSIRALAESGVV